MEFLLICKNTLIQAVLLKKKNHVPAEYGARLAGIARRHDSTRPRTLTLLKRVNFTTYFFSRDKMPINMNMLVFLPGTAAKCCELKRCADRVRSRTDNKDEGLEGKFSNLNFSPFTEKTTEYFFKLFLSIYRYLIFSQVLNYTSVELNRFAKQAKLLYI